VAVVLIIFLFIFSPPVFGTEGTFGETTIFRKRGGMKLS